MNAIVEECPRVAMRMECEECGYPYCEAELPTDAHTPHGGQ